MFQEVPESLIRMCPRHRIDRGKWNCKVSNQFLACESSCQGA